MAIGRRDGSPSRGHPEGGRRDRLRGRRPACWSRRGRSGSASWRPGARASTARAGRLHFTREGAHSRNRVLHALGDATGWEMVRALLDRAQRTPRHRRCARSPARSTSWSRTACPGLPLPGRAPAWPRPVLARGHPAGHRRGGPGVRGDDQSSRGHRRRRGHGPARRGRTAWTWSSCSSTPPRWPSPAPPASSSPKRCAAKEPTCATRRESASRRSWPRATRWRAPSRAKCGRDAGPVTLDLSHLDPERVRTPLPAHRRHLRALRRRPHPRSGPGHAGRALRDGRGGHRPARPVHADPASTRRVRPRPPACTARTGWPATRCSRGSSSALAPRRPWSRTRARPLRSPCRRLPPPPGTVRPTGGDPAAVVARLRRGAWENLGLERDGNGLRALLVRADALGEAVEPHPGRPTRRPRRATSRRGPGHGHVSPLPRGEPRRPLPHSISRRPTTSDSWATRCWTRRWPEAAGRGRLDLWRELR